MKTVNTLIIILVAVMVSIWSSSSEAGFDLSLPNESYAFVDVEVGMFLRGGCHSHTKCGRRDGRIPSILRVGYAWEWDKIAIEAALAHRSNADTPPPEYNYEMLTVKARYKF